jgi:uncharacterized membrane protein
MSEVQETQEVRGVGFVVAAFDNEEAAEQVLKAMKQAKKDGQMYYEAAAIVRKDDDGDIHYHESGDMSTGKGAGIGALVGGAIGLLGGWAGVALGAGAGALVGGLFAHGDAGFDNKRLKELGAALKPGTSAVVAITSKDFLDAFQKQVSGEDIWNLLSSISSSISDSLAVGQDTVIGIAITDQGIAVGKVAADDEVAQVMSVAVTEEGAVATAAVATDEGVDVATVEVTPEEDDTQSE